MGIRIRPKHQMTQEAGRVRAGGTGSVLLYLSYAEKRSSVNSYQVTVVKIARNRKQVAVKGEPVKE